MRTKLEIKGFKDPKFNSAVSGARGVFKLQINPKDYSIKNEAPPKDNTENQLLNGQTVEPKTLSTKPTLSLTFYLDSTGVVSGCESVPKAIEDLKWLCLDYQGEIHDSFYLQVIWNSLVFNCKCKAIAVDYLLFKPDGEPVRAKVTATFEEFIDAALQAMKNNTSSPDLTHLRTLRAGDTLPNLCAEIYGNPKYYLQVAKANGIVNFRRLKPGRQILFPRLEK